MLQLQATIVLRPEALEVFMEKHDLNEDGNIAFQEAGQLPLIQKHGTVHEWQNGVVQATQIL